MTPLGPGLQASPEDFELVSLCNHVCQLLKIKLFIYTFHFVGSVSLENPNTDFGISLNTIIL